MGTDVKFSIIIPVYNVEEYLEECIESVLRQTYPYYEIMLVDDGSKDHSGEICDYYAKQYPDKVKVIHNENQGPLLARDCGIQNATGDILWMIDSDDCIRFDALEVLKTEFDRTSCDMVLFNASKEENFEKPYFEFPFKNGQLFSGESKKILYQMMITTSKLNSLCIKAIKRVNAIPENLKYFGLKNAEDLLFSISLLSCAKNIVYINQNLYYYRSHPGSIVHTYNPERHRAIKTVHLEMEKYIDEWGMGVFHEKHHAREVRGWIDCLWQMLLNANVFSCSLLHELAADEYFRNAYERMDRSALSLRDRILSRWLYRKQYGIIRFAGTFLRAARAVKQKFRK